MAVRRSFHFTCTSAAERIMVLPWSDPLGSVGCAGAPSASPSICCPTWACAWWRGCSRATEACASHHPDLRLDSHRSGPDTFEKPSIRTGFNKIPLLRSLASGSRRAAREAVGAGYPCPVAPAGRLLRPSSEDSREGSSSSVKYQSTSALTDGRFNSKCFVVGNRRFAHGYGRDSDCARWCAIRVDVVWFPWRDCVQYFGAVRVPPRAFGMAAQRYSDYPRCPPPLPDGLGRPPAQVTGFGPSR